MGEWVVWGVQSAVLGLMGLVFWSLKRVLAELERRIEQAEETAEIRCGEFERTLEELRTESRREGEAHLRRCEGLQSRIGGVERHAAIDMGRWEGLQRELSQIRAGIERLEGRLFNGGK